MNRDSDRDNPGQTGTIRDNRDRNEPGQSGTDPFRVSRTVPVCPPPFVPCPGVPVFLPTQRIDSVWHVQAAHGWRPIRDPLVIAILDAWPDAQVSLVVREPQQCGEVDEAA